jgi:hypothetical protein
MFSFEYGCFWLQRRHTYSSDRATTVLLFDSNDMCSTCLNYLCWRKTGSAYLHIELCTPQHAAANSTSLSQMARGRLRASRRWVSSASRNMRGVIVFAKTANFSRPSS